MTETNVRRAHPAISRLIASYVRGPIDNTIGPEELVDDEWAKWYPFTPLQRWHDSGELWEHYRQIGGSLDPEPDTETPFYDGRPRKPGEAKSREGQLAKWQQAERKQGTLLLFTAWPNSHAVPLLLT